MKTSQKYLLLLAAMAGLAPLAQAVPELRLFDGTNTITITDNLANDSQSAAGQIVFVGSIGTWAFNVHTATTYPIIGSLTNPMLDLSFDATSTGAGGTLQIWFSADGFGPTSGATLNAIGGVNGAGGSVSVQAFGGTNNTEFDTSNLLLTQGPLSGGTFADTAAGGTISSAGPYALTEEVSITAGAGTVQTTGNSLLSVPDSGTSILLLGAGLVAIGLVARFRPSFI